MFRIFVTSLFTLNLICPLGIWVLVATSCQYVPVTNRYQWDNYPQLTGLSSYPRIGAGQNRIPESQAFGGKNLVKAILKSMSKCFLEQIPTESTIHCSFLRRPGDGDSSNSPDVPCWVTRLLLNMNNQLTLGIQGIPGEEKYSHITVDIDFG